MPCFNPMKGYRARTVNPSGKRGIVFNPRDGFVDLPMDFPCGKCLGCQLERSRQWAMRCVHEADLFGDENMFLTLTIDDHHMPNSRSLDVRHLQKFMKRLRRRYGKCRFFACGEYGEKNMRPHYHVLIFGLRWPQAVDGKEKEGGMQLIEDGENRLYSSKILESLWPMGFSTIGALTFESAAYCARYMLKKVSGPKAAERYAHVVKRTGEIQMKKPEFIVMSRNPGIGKGWYDQFAKEVYGRTESFIVVRGVKMQPPRFYDKLLEKDNPRAWERMKYQRMREALTRKDDGTTQRLIDRMIAAQSKIGLGHRRLEDGTQSF